MVDSVIVGWTLGVLIALVIIVVQYAIKVKREGGDKLKKIATDYPAKAKLQCTSETPVFSAPAQCACTLFVGEKGLEIKVLLDKKTKTDISFLIDYSKLLRVYFDKELLYKRPRFGEIMKQENIPDYFLVEYKEDDGSVQQLRFYQTEKNKEKNEVSLFLLRESDPGFITTINARIDKAARLQNPHVNKIL